MRDLKLIQIDGNTLKMNQVSAVWVQLGSSGGGWCEREAVVRWSAGATVGHLLEAARRDGWIAPGTENLVVDGAVMAHHADLADAVPADGMELGGPVGPSPPCGDVVRSVRRRVVALGLDLTAEVPAVPSTASPKLSLVSLLAPLAVSFAMALLFNPMFVLFGVLGPVVMVGRWWDSRRTHRRAWADHERELGVARAGVAARALALRDHVRDVSAARQPGVCTALDRLRRGAPELWERRCDDDDALVVGLGVGDMAIEWDAAPDPALGGERVDRSRRVPRSRIGVDLGEGAVAFVGGPCASGALRAAVLQLAIQLGPADLDIVWAGPAGWGGWLPHLRSTAVLDGPPRIDGGTRLTLLVVPNGAAWTSLPRSWRAAAERGSIAAAHRVDRSEDVPPGTSWLVECSDPPILRMLDGGGQHAVTRLDQLSEREATRAARLLARRTDPDVDGGDLPSSVDLTSLVAADRDAVAARWASADPAGLSFVLGVAAGGDLRVDLVADGPHALVSGTTGSGKSELLRTLVTGIALERSPSEATFLLIDFKGGGGLDAVAGLPHCVGVVSDLDGHLAERALRSLRAEVRSRERTFRDAGVSEISHLRQAGVGLPSLVVVVDEFATLAAELPEFLESLIDVAQRGRSLGIHLILASQRPAGVVDAKIKANTNLRIALRSQDEADSYDVIGVPDAAGLPAHPRGRALLRRGGDLVMLQTAYVSAPACDEIEVVIESPESAQSSAIESGAGTVLDRVVGAIEQAHGGGPNPVSPFLPPLPATLSRDHVASQAVSAVRPNANAVPIGLIDAPDVSEQMVRWWDPLREHAVIIGREASPVIAAMVLSAVERHDPNDLHLYAIADPSSSLGALRQLPHCGGVADPSDGEVIERLLGEFNRPAAANRLLVVDDLALLSQALQEGGRQDLVGRVFGLITAASSGHRVLAAMPAVRDVPLRVLHAFEHQIALPGSDTSSLLALAPSGLDVRLLERRPVDLTQGLEIALPRATAAHVDAAAAATCWSAGGGPRHVGPLPTCVHSGLLDQAAVLDSDRILLPVGLGVGDAETATLSVEGVCAVLGSRASGRSGLLRHIAEAVRRQLPQLGVRMLGEHAALSPCVGDADLVLLDDAERLEASEGEALLAWQRVAPRRWLVVATRPELLRDHLSWLAALRSASAACLLQPQPGDADPFRAVLPLRGAQRWVPGRGFTLTRGLPQLVQFALVDDGPAGGAAADLSRPSTG